MGRAAKRDTGDGGLGAPMWMVSFSDCMTNLLTFFVLLVTFSCYDEDTRQTIQSLGSAFRKIFPPVMQNPTDRSALEQANQIWAMEKPFVGTERPEADRVRKDTSGVLRQTAKIVDYERHKVFWMASKRVFLGNGAVLSPEGRYILPVMGAFLKEMQGRVVISENGPGGDEPGEALGLSRAWAAADFLATNQKLDKSRFSISATTMLRQKEYEGSRLEQGMEKNDRLLEIIMLERSIHD